jgi:hypothetical protein
VLEVLGQDGIALVYAAKVRRALVGAPLAPATTRPLPLWASRRWRDLPLGSRLRIWIGPTSL